MQPLRVPCGETEAEAAGQAGTRRSLDLMFYCPCLGVEIQKVADPAEEGRGPTPHSGVRGLQLSSETRPLCWAMGHSCWKLRLILGLFLVLGHLSVGETDPPPPPQGLCLVSSA